MEKRLLLAVVLSFIVVFGYNALFLPPEPPKPAATPSPAAPAAPAAQPGVPPGPGAGPAQGATPPAEPVPVEAAPVVSDTAERDVTFENEAVSAVFTTRGGALKSWRLKKYQDAAGKPLELVPPSVPPGTPRPFTLSAEEPAVAATLAQALYKPSATEVRVTDAPVTLTFDYQDASGLSARKDFTFSPDSPYVFTLSATVKQGEREIVPTVYGGAGIGSGLVMSSMGTYSPPPQPIFYRDGDVSRVATSDIPANAVQEGTFGFAGVDDHYFLFAAIDAQPLRLTYKALDVPVSGTEEVAHFVEWSVRFPNPQHRARFFLGPKDFDVLAAVDRDLVRSIHFGIFAWLVVPLLQALKWVNGYVGNYGWSIIILTVIINLAMFPLRHKSVVSMRRMQEVQPEVKAIQDRYAKLKMSDPARQKMNAEMMTLYRERGVNPASGCVPMLLTLPVLFAFYSMLSVAIELRGAPFVGWIRDLSVYDPLFITPVLMGLTQFVQTKMTPSTADPMQQKMMLFMPLIFMTMFIWAPSGLVLYWTVSNLWAIGQQVLTNKIIGPTPQRSVGGKPDRKVKNVGGGKTDQASGKTDLPAGKTDLATKERK
jgi:YidC/Oxa1 family membrane protein insertase